MLRRPAAAATALHVDRGVGGVGGGAAGVALGPDEPHEDVLERGARDAKGGDVQRRGVHLQLTQQRREDGVCVQRQADADVAPRDGGDVGARDARRDAAEQRRNDLGRRHRVAVERCRDRVAEAKRGLQEEGRADGAEAPVDHHCDAVAERLSLATPGG